MATLGEAPSLTTQINVLVLHLTKPKIASVCSQTTLPPCPWTLTDDNGEETVARTWRQTEPGLISLFSSKLEIASVWFPSTVLIYPLSQISGQNRWRKIQMLLYVKGPGMAF